MGILVVTVSETLMMIQKTLRHFFLQFHIKAGGWGSRNIKGTSLHKLTFGTRVTQVLKKLNAIKIKLKNTHKK